MIFSDPCECLTVLCRFFIQCAGFFRRLKSMVLVLPTEESLFL
ncbi:hypothetical protein D932_01320 [Enterococcus casseliflavus 14-MB-W-14]|nr:hypothetical protein D932_01320 [Enterococcus casseliflavus 14-MB-W-14]